MSTMSEIFATGLAQLATVKGESVGYRVGTSGSYTTLTGFVLNIDRLPAPAMDPDHQSQETLITATLKGPVTPLLVRGYQVKDNVSGITFAVESVKIDTQQVVILNSINTQQFAPDRKGAR
jgi:hypothetical protein